MTDSNGSRDAVNAWYMGEAPDRYTFHVESGVAEGDVSILYADIA